MAIAFYGFLLVALNWIVGWNIYDLTLMPRLLALMVFLALAVPVFAFQLKRWRRRKKFLLLVFTKKIKLSQYRELQ